MIVNIESAGDPRVHEYVALTDVNLRSLREPADGLFIAEGEKVIRRALDAGFEPRSLLLGERWREPLADVVEAYPSLPVMVASDPVLETITGYRVHRGALASMSRNPLPHLDSVLASARRLLVLEDIVDHTNVGAAFRSAAALGIDGVLVTPRCADPLYRRSVRVSMGAVFSVPWTRIEPWPHGLATLRSHGITVLALTPDSEAVDIRSLAVPDRWALVLGTEGDGLRIPTMQNCDARVRIPMSAGIDSLNVAAAAAVAMYALQ